MGNDCVLYTTLSDIAGIQAEGWTIGGAPTVEVNPFSRGMRFDGTNDWIIIPDSYELRFDSGAQDFSLVAMVMLPDASGSHLVFDKRDADDDGWRLIVSANQALGSINAIDVASAAGAVANNTWTLIGFSVDRSGDGQIYINGLASGAAVAIGGAAMATTSNIYIGRRSYANADAFAGDIDSGIIFDRILSAAEHLNIYNQYIGAA